MNRVASLAFKALAQSDVPCILLKGPAIATWIYDEDELRPYRDIDLLVLPAAFDRAVETLADLGYVHWLDGADASEFGANEVELIGADGVCIDLHHALIGVERNPGESWNVLWRRTVPLRLPGGAEVQVLDVPARALHLALHAAQNGPSDVKAVADLGRGLQRVPGPDWEAAAALAAELDATEAFAAGLRVLPEGAELAESFRLPTTLSVELTLRTTSAPQDSLFFERLRAASGIRERAVLLTRKLLPTAAYLRANSEVARHGPVGLLAARVWRIVMVLRRFPPALRAWQGARSMAKKGSIQ
ncbi:MAG: nucleotidyltransferase family protein [Actinomycetota bacterium]|nr:nucleotidyltransferase family protein [Actinomycetota bacterium]